MGDDNLLLYEAEDRLKSCGFERIDTVWDSIDNNGVTHLILAFKGESFSLRAKQYRYEGNASFGLEQVEQADEDGHVLLSYVDDIDIFAVFDPAAVLKDGDCYNQPSKQSVSRTWIEVPAEYGVEITEYLNDEAEPRGVSGENSALTEFAV
jgi:hypothetical protein